MSLKPLLRVRVYLYVSQSLTLGFEVFSKIEVYLIKKGAIRLVKVLPFGRFQSFFSRVHTFTIQIALY